LKNGPGGGRFLNINLTLIANTKSPGKQKRRCGPCKISDVILEKGATKKKMRGKKRVSRSKRRKRGGFKRKLFGGDA